MITVVTAFFDINRENWKKYERNNDIYVQAFSRWAHLNNNLVVYVEDEGMRDTVLTIRESYGLKEQTVVHIISEIRCADEELYNSIKKIELNNDIHKKWRMGKESPEVSNADYNYIMCIKFWLLMHTVEEDHITGELAWIDFGYEHNGVVFPYEEDYKFLWQYDFNNKITLFSLKEMDNRPIFDIINTMDTYIMGGICVVPADECKTFWQLIRESMMALNSMGYMDDDQILLLMAYRKRPDIIQVFLSDWYMPIKQYGNVNMRTRGKAQKRFPLYSVLRKIKHFLHRIQYYSEMESHLRNIKMK